jgi:hypothetical protein
MVMMVVMMHGGDGNDHGSNNDGGDDNHGNNDGDYDGGWLQ